ncbi:ammonium transporter [Archaeoglobus veneficus]|uniref:Ammonium transporter n=1 Tax=Archaeoglobus veneficus (strain DSM 11195 / SNP6) TaxID=693661 RepID=F2KS58_ARCVS|nr:ammonium transporter [Archaeoglobus veneficus]AEA47997.1 ammonium transporter [Archaeoglobus veneficus SNP6]
MDDVAVAWLLASTALVMLMTPGVGLFYAGMVRRKNAVYMITLSFIAYILVSLQWVLTGYSLSFGDDIAGIIGIGGIMPIDIFAIYQLTFAAITLAIITSAAAERMKLSAFVVFGLLWTTLVYDPFAHWLWGNGWLAQLGALDFAGGVVVHISSGFGALALAIALGARKGLGEYSMEPHNIPMTLLGAALLWFGWFGFNGGSALAANETAVRAIIVTNTAAATGALVWMILTWTSGRPGSLSIVTGAIAGLAAITPAAGFVSIPAAIVIGIVAGLICYRAMLFRINARLDESLDAWAIHGVGGLWGTIALGIFAKNGLISGNTSLFVSQVIAVVVSVIYAFAVTFILAKIVDAAIGLRVSEEEEYVGLDISQHGETAYA